jgi:SLOG family YspA-like protein
MGKRVAIVGSRDWPEPEAVRDYVFSLSRDDTVISGGAPGVDTQAELAADEYGLPFIKYSAKWDEFGRVAGFIRNKEIVMACDRLVAFHWRNSKGTALSIQLAKDMGKSTIVFTKSSGQLGNFHRPVEKP